jgi:hypothetical protein
LRLKSEHEDAVAEARVELQRLHQQLAALKMHGGGEGCTQERLRSQLSQAAMGEGEDEQQVPPQRGGGRLGLARKGVKAKGAGRGQVKKPGKAAATAGTKGNMRSRR